MSWTPIAPWRPVPGSGQNISFNGTSQASNAITDPATRAVQLSAIGGNCHVSINAAATATDMLIKASDPPYVMRIAKGETVTCIQDQSSTGTLNLIEVSH
jgi:hypothetical protein